MARLTDLLFAITAPGPWTDLSANGRPPAEVEALMQTLADAVIDRFPPRDPTDATPS